VKRVFGGWRFYGRHAGDRAAVAAVVSPFVAPPVDRSIPDGKHAGAAYTGSS
jgi:hypothetical protein